MSNEKNLSLIASRLFELRDHVDSSYLFPTPEPKARMLIKENPFAFCAAVCLDQEQKQILFGQLLDPAKGRSF